jgi:uncharacterized YccA/Bax inhibitor family protein
MMRSSNPVFTRIRPAAQATDEISWPAAPPGTPTAEELARIYRQPSSLTVDDVVVHTLMLFGLAAVGGTFGWLLVGRSPALVALAAVVSIGLNIAIMVTGRVSKAMVIAFTVPYGVLIGGVSHLYESAYAGIIPQALLGTAVIFIAMLLLHRSGRLRATPRMYRIVGGALLGLFVTFMVDFMLNVTTGYQLPIVNSASPLGILFSVAVLVIASLQFTLDFDMIERAIAAGAPRADAWRCAYGLLISFAWVYLEMLRLLGKLRR